MKLLAVFLPCVLLCISAQLIESPPKVQLFLLQLRVRLLTNKLYEKCPDLIVDEGFLRDKSGDSLTVEQNIEIEQQIYEHVQELMMRCNQGNSTTSRPPTTSALLPSQCTSSSTVNLTESWRNNYPLSDGQNRDVDLLRAGVTWFRITGAAGNLVQNTCPNIYSCGSQNGAYWTNSTLPTRIGETVSITFYESLTSTAPLGDCDNNNGLQRGRATRCSAANGDVVHILDVALVTWLSADELLQ